MHWMIISAVLAVSLGGYTSGWAQDCGPLKPQRTIDTEVRRETESNASVLMKSLGQGTIRNEYQRIEKNQQFSNADDTHRWTSFIYMLCTLLEDSDLSDNDRLVQYFKLVELSRQSPPVGPPISQPAAPTTPFLPIAQEQCGDPPPVANESLRGDIEGKAQIISRFLGDASLSGKIDTSRSEIFSKYQDAELSRSNAYFEYQVCILIMSDKTLSTREKIAELTKVRREFSKPISAAPGSFSTPAANVLYETGVDKGEFEGWGLTPGWIRYRGKLLNDGSVADKGFAPSMAPYAPADEDYAIEAEIRVVEDSTRHGDSFGLIARASDQNGYAVGVADDASGRICYLSAWTGVGHVGGGNGIRDNTRCKPRQPFTPGAEWRRYRLELRGNSITLRIDDAIITRATDNKFLTGGGVGLWSVGYQLEVRQFKVVKL